MTDRTLDRMLEVAIAIAREAGLFTLSAYRTSPSTRSKRCDVDLVTQVDVDSEALISSRLAQHFPDHGLVSEEGTNRESAQSTALWIVDPLDGTVNFAHGHPFYCISMALAVDGKVVVGVVHAPVLGVTWSARRGGGAFRNGAPIAVTATGAVDAALCATGFPYDRHEATDNNTSEWSLLIRRARALRCCGAAAIDLAMVADGTYDGYWEKRLNPWDVAAGTLIVEEAGGRVTAVDGSPVPPWPEVIVATNGLVHDEILRALESDPVV